MMNNNYLINASAFLDKLVEEMDIELFIQQYKSLDHECLSQSISLDDHRINDYYNFCINITKKKEGYNSASWSYFIEEISMLSRKNSLPKAELYFKTKVIRSHSSNTKKHDFYGMFMSKTTDTTMIKSIVNKAKYDTFDTTSNIAA